MAWMHRWFVADEGWLVSAASRIRRDFAGVEMGAPFTRQPRFTHRALASVPLLVLKQWRHKDFAALPGSKQWHTKFCDRLLRAIASAPRAGADRAKVHVLVHGQQVDFLARQKLVNGPLDGTTIVTLKRNQQRIERDLVPRCSVCNHGDQRLVALGRRSGRVQQARPDVTEIAVVNRPAGDRRWGGEYVVCHASRAAAAARGRQPRSAVRRRRGIAGRIGGDRWLGQLADGQAKRRGHARAGFFGA